MRASVLSDWLAQRLDRGNGQPIYRQLHRLLQQANPGLQIIRQDDVPSAFDYHCPIMSLPLAFGNASEV